MLKNKLLLLIYSIIFFTTSSTIYASTNYPFPQNINYKLKHVLPNYERSQMDNDVENYYSYWKQRYVVDAGKNANNKQMYRISFPDKYDDGRDETVSEGQGYGMIIVAIMAENGPDAKNIFDGLWYYSRSALSENNNNFMLWTLADREEGKNSAAFDADADF
jgi:endoglucanase